MTGHHGLENKRIEIRSLPNLLVAILASLPSMSLIPSAPLYLACSRSLDRYLTALPAMSLAQSLHSLSMAGSLRVTIDH
jgi:hypothetical protein